MYYMIQLSHGLFYLRFQVQKGDRCPQWRTYFSDRLTLPTNLVFNISLPFHHFSRFQTRGQFRTDTDSGLQKQQRFGCIFTWGILIELDDGKIYRKSPWKIDGVKSHGFPVIFSANSHGGFTAFHSLRSTVKSWISTVAMTDLD